MRYDMNYTSYSPLQESEDSSHTIPPYGNVYDPNDPVNNQPSNVPVNPSPASPTDPVNPNSPTNNNGGKGNSTKIIIICSSFIFFVITIVTCACCCRKRVTKAGLPNNENQQRLYSGNDPSVDELDKDDIDVEVAADDKDVKRNSGLI
jgi:hypothetical protein